MTFNGAFVEDFQSIGRLEGIDKGLLKLMYKLCLSVFIFLIWQSYFPKRAVVLGFSVENNTCNEIIIKT